MGRAAGQEDHNDRLVRAAVSGIGVGAEQVRQGQSAQSEPSDFEKVAARNAVAKLRCVSRYSNHSSKFRFKRRSIGASIYFIEGLVFLTVDKKERFVKHFFLILENRIMEMDGQDEIFAFFLGSFR